MDLDDRAQCLRYLVSVGIVATIKANNKHGKKIIETVFLPWRVDKLNKICRSREKLILQIEQVYDEFTTELI